MSVRCTAPNCPCSFVSVALPLSRRHAITHQRTVSLSLSLYHSAAALSRFHCHSITQQLYWLTLTVTLSLSSCTVSFSLSHRHAVTHQLFCRYGTQLPLLIWQNILHPSEPVYFYTTDVHLNRPPRPLEPIDPAHNNSAGGDAGLFKCCDDCCTCFDSCSSNCEGCCACNVEKVVSLTMRHLRTHFCVFSGHHACCHWATCFGPFCCTESIDDRCSHMLCFSHTPSRTLRLSLSELFSCSFSDFLSLSGSLFPLRSYFSLPLTLWLSLSVALVSHLLFLRYQRWDNEYEEAAKERTSHFISHFSSTDYSFEPATPNNPDVLYRATKKTSPNVLTGGGGFACLTRCHTLVVTFSLSNSHVLSHLLAVSLSLSCWHSLSYSLGPKELKTKISLTHSRFSLTRARLSTVYLSLHTHNHILTHTPYHLYLLL